MFITLKSEVLTAITTSKCSASQLTSWFMHVTCLNFEGEKIYFSETPENLHLTRCIRSEKKILFLITVFTIYLYSDPPKSSPKFGLSTLNSVLTFTSTYNSPLGLLFLVYRKIFCLFLTCTIRARNVTYLINIGFTSPTSKPKY